MVICRVKTEVGAIMENFNKETYIVSELMEKQVLLQNDFNNRKSIKKKQ